MAGMFYSLKETADRLGKTEEEVRKMSQQGKLRIFRDGSHELFKVDEVNALMAEGIGMELEEGPPVTAEMEESADVSNLEPSSTESEESFDVDEMLGLSDDKAKSEAPAADVEAGSDIGLVSNEPQAEASSEFQLAPEEADAEASSEFDLTPGEAEAQGSSEVELTPEEADAAASSEIELAPEAEAEATSEMGLTPEAEAEGTTAEDELFLLEDDEKPAGSTSQAAQGLDGTEEIALAPETGAPASESDITDMDTAMGSEGVNVLGETDTGYDVTEDSMAETVGPAGSTGTAAGSGAAGTDAEASLEEIEDDVNLDSFGSGSGLLDLSLQADDTSLGGILDEIYTSEGGEGGEAPATAEAGTVEDITAEAEHVGPEEELAAPEAAAVAPMAVPTFAAYAEAPPDSQSNILGMLLFLPLLVLLYTAIVALSAQREVMPSILSSVRGMVWYLMGGAVVLTAVVVGAAFFMGGEHVKVPKKPKELKVKAPKAKKEKPAKEAKVARPEAAKEKPAKEKKGFFGKKKK
jgi:excisionase family DNA binding protein